jgi:hypothetical protein
LFGIRKNLRFAALLAPSFARGGRFSLSFSFGHGVFCPAGWALLWFTP